MVEEDVDPCSATDQTASYFCRALDAYLKTCFALHQTSPCSPILQCLSPDKQPCGNTKAAVTGHPVGGDMQKSKRVAVMQYQSFLHLRL